MVPAGNKAKCISSVNHTAKSIHHLIKDKFNQIIDQFNRRKATSVKFYSILLNKLHPFYVNFIKSLNYICNNVV